MGREEFRSSTSYLGVSSRTAGLADGQATLHRLIKAKDGVTEAGSDLDVFCLYLRPKVMLPKIGLEVLGYRSVPDYDASERLVE